MRLNKRIPGGRFLIGKGHNDSLRVVTKVFAENIDATHMHSVRLDAEFQFNAISVLQMQITEENMSVDDLIADFDAGVINTELKKLTVLGAVDEPIFRSELSATAAVIPGTCIGKQLDAVDVEGNVAGPVCTAVYGFAAKLQGKGDLLIINVGFAEKEVVGKFISNKAGLEP